MRFELLNWNNYISDTVLFNINNTAIFNFKISEL